MKVIFKKSDNEIIHDFHLLKTREDLANLLEINDKSLRYILIKIHCSPAVTYLHVENSTAEPVTIKNNHIVTHKQSSGHGYGLQNIKTILERHQALYTLSYQEADMIFCFSAQILPN